MFNQEQYLESQAVVAFKVNRQKSRDWYDKCSERLSQIKARSTVEELEDEVKQQDRTIIKLSVALADSHQENHRLYLQIAELENGLREAKRVATNYEDLAAKFHSQFKTAQSKLVAFRDDAAELLESQHSWISNVAAAKLILGM